MKIERRVTPAGYVEYSQIQTYALYAVHGVLRMTLFLTDSYG